MTRGGKVSASATQAGPSDYDPSSPPTLTLRELVNIESEADVKAEAVESGNSDMFGAQVTSVNGNEVSVELYAFDSAHQASDGAAQVLGASDSGTDVSDTTIRVSGRGFGGR